jgi:hypothetical protein
MRRCWIAGALAVLLLLSGGCGLFEDPADTSSAAGEIPVTETPSPAVYYDDDKLELFSPFQRELYRLLQNGELGPGEECYFNTPQDYEDVFEVMKVYHLLEEEINDWEGGYHATILAPELIAAYGERSFSFDEVLNVCPDYGPKYPISGEDAVVGIRFQEPDYPEYFAQKSAAYAAAEEALLAGLPGREASEYERARALAERLCESLHYEEGVEARNSYGAVVEGKAVCVGYAAAYARLARKMGLRCLFANGSDRFRLDENETHVWNLVRVDGKWYHVDVTWMDRGDTAESIRWEYFLLSDQQILTDHEYTRTQGETDPQFWLPEAPDQYQYGK